MIAPLSSPDRTPRVRVLHLEDSRIDQKLAAAALKNGPLRCEIVCVDTLEDFLAQLQSHAVDVVIADYFLPSFTAIDAWHAAQMAARQPRLEMPQKALGVLGEAGNLDAFLADFDEFSKQLADVRDRLPPFVLLSGAIGEAAAVEAMRLGMADYVLKDDIARLPYVVARALEVARARAREAAAQARLAASQRQLAALTEHLQQSIERERAAIAREIHDDIGGSLTAVKFELAWLLRHAAEERAREHARGALAMLEHALGASQRIMQDLRPPVLDAGLVAAVQWLVQDFERRQGVRVHFSASHAEMALSAAVQIVAYRTAQEALTNVAKYAQATQVWVDLADGEGALTLEVRDDGCGMDAPLLERVRAGQSTGPNTQAVRGGFGLLGLAERARTVGGWLDVSSRIGRGTSIILTVPVAENPAENVKIA